METMHLKDKLVKVGENIAINMYDNGFVVEVPGRNNEGDWVTAKVLAVNIDEVFDLIKEASTLERDS